MHACLSRLLVATAMAAPALLGAGGAHAADASVKQCIDANESSIKLQADHKLSEAREQLLACAATSCPDEIRAECERRLKALDAARPSTAGGPATGTVPGSEPTAAPGPAPVPTAGVEPATATGPVPTPEPPEPGRDPAWLAGGLVTAGLGLVGIVVGAVFGAKASSEWSSSQSNCETSASCPNHAQAVMDHDDAVVSANVSTAALVIGSAALVTGGIVFFAAPYVEPEQGTSAGLRIGGAF